MCWSSKRVCSYASQSENRPASVPRPAKARKQARLKHLHVGLDPRRKIDENPLKKMIKDHFIACTTKMLEILANQSPGIVIIPGEPIQDPLSARPGLTPIHEPTSSRLSDYSLVKELVAPMATTYTITTGSTSPFPAKGGESYLQFPTCQPPP